MKEYIHKPCKIQAEQYLDEKILKFTKGAYINEETGELFIETPKGTKSCKKGDYIIKKTNGEYSIIKKGIFIELYSENKYPDKNLTYFYEPIPKCSAEHYKNFLILDKMENLLFFVSWSCYHKKSLLDRIRQSKHGELTKAVKQGELVINEEDHMKKIIQKKVKEADEKAKKEISTTITYGTSD